MAINNLQEYMVERLLDLDPTLSSRQGAQMFVKVIDPLISRLGTDPISTDIESFIVQRIRNEFPDLDIDSPGSTLRDIIVSPMILLMEPIRREIEFLRTQQSLASAESLSNDEMDALLANVFATRSLGDFARGAVRVFFSAPYNVGIDPTITFSTSSGLVFIPEVSTVANISEFQRSGAQYYIDIPVRSSEASIEYNVNAGDINTSTGLRNVVRVSNQIAFSGGISTETNEEFLERAERSLSERSLNTRRGIETSILNNFSDIVSIDVVGFGEAEMQRDVLQGDVVVDLSESPGPLSYMTSDWKTHEIISGFGAINLPFTNTLMLPQPASGWDDQTEQRIMESSFLRIADGEPTNFENRILGRVRKIVDVFQDATGDIYIKTDDFEIYPTPSSIDGTADAGSVNTMGFDQGLNKESFQGSDFDMTVEVDGFDRVRGSHLPFTDIVETDFASFQVPGSVIKGRDFLFLSSNELFDRNEDSDLGMTVPVKIRTFPLTRFFNSTKLGVGRTDSFLISKSRYLYKGVDVFEFDPSINYCAINESPKVIDYGSPKYSTSTSNYEEAYGGETSEEGGRNPGAALEGKLVGMYGAGTIPDTTLPEEAIDVYHECDLVLHPSQKPWDERGVQIGHHVACTVYGIGRFYNFDGKLTNVEDNLVWQGFGRVKRVSFPDRWRLRVEGLDWTPLEEGQLAGFSASAYAEVRVTGVQNVDEGGSSVQTNEGEHLIYGNNFPPDTLSNFTLSFDTDKSGAADTYLCVSAMEQWYNPSTSTFEPSETLNSRSEIQITVDTATYAGNPLPEHVRFTVNAEEPVARVICNTDPIGPAADILHPNDFIDALIAAVEDAKIINYQPGTGGYGLIEKNPEDSINKSGPTKAVFRSMLYGNIPVEQGWSAEIRTVADGQEIDYAAHGITISAFSEVANRSVAALAGQLVRNANRRRIKSEEDFPYYAVIKDGTEDTVVFTSTKSGSLGNGESIQGGYGSRTVFEPSSWDNNSNGDGTIQYENINGGLNSGFGPMKQVAGVSPDSKLLHDGDLLFFGLLEEQGYEALELTRVSESSNSYFTRTAHQHLIGTRTSSDSGAMVRMIIEVEDQLFNTVDEVMEDHQLRWVLEPDGDGTFVINDTLSNTGDFAEPTYVTNYALDNFSGTIDFQTGVISLELDGSVTLPDSGFSVFIGYNYYDSPYKVSWTIYRGSIETLDAQGKSSISYDDFVFPPALKAASDKTIARSPSGYDGRRFVYDSPPYGNWADLTSSYALGMELGSEDKETRYRAAWIRLGKPFNVDHPSIGGPPSALLTSAEYVVEDANVDGLQPHQTAYPEERYDESPGNTGIFTKTSLPISEGSIGNGFETTDEGGLTLLETASANKANLKGTTGFLIPHPMGTASYNEEYVLPLVQDEGAFDHQVLQLFEAAPTDFGDTRLQISGIPGGVPFPGQLSADFQVENDKVHIGGMTDVYVRPARSNEATTAVITLQPDQPSANGPSDDIVISASDGRINPLIDPSHFFSAELEAELTNIYGSAPVSVSDLVLEIIEPPTAELQPSFVRIINSISGGVKVDGSFPSSLDAGFENLRFRVMRSVTTSLNRPLSILQQGSDLSTTENSFDVLLAGGVEFSTDPTTTEIFLSIDSGESMGEYTITDRNLSKLILDRVPNTSESGLSYRVYSKQTAKVTLPLVRVREITLSDDSAGVKVPYAAPVDIIASSFAGLNDDPITEDIGSWDGGTLGIETVDTLEGDTEARCVFTREGANFKDYGVIRYDVLVLQELDAPLRHWYIDDIVIDDDGNYSKLILDRVETITGDTIETPFVIGKPSIGTAKLRFLDRTFFEVRQDTVFHYTDPVSNEKHFLRPSPAEFAPVYRNVDNRSDVKVFATDTNALVTTDDFFKHGVSVGDRIRIVTKVLKSAEFNGSTEEHENIMAAGKTLAFKVNNTIRTVTFSGPNPIDINTIINDINRQMGGLLRADVNIESRDNDGDGTEEDYYRIMIFSSNDVEVVTQGTIGILETLKMTSDTDNTPTGSLIDEYRISQLVYIKASETSDGSPRTKLIITDEDGGVASLPVDAGVGALGYETLFVEIFRRGRQRVYPSELVQDPDGLFSADIKLTSFSPNVSEGVVPDDSTLVVSNMLSLGYTLSVENNNYSYSVGENVSVKCTAVVLDEDAIDFSEAYEIAGAGVTISYDNAPSIDSIQAYMLSPSLRVLCNNPLVRHYLPAYPILSISYAGKMSEKAVRDTVSEHMSSLYPNRPLEVYSLTSKLSRLGVSYLKFPQDAGFIVHDKDRNISVVRNKDVVSLTKQDHIMDDSSRISVTKVG